MERDTQSGLYVGIVPGLHGAHTQAETLDELQDNLREVIELCLEEMDPDEKAQLPEYIGIPIEIEGNGVVYPVK